MQTVISLFTALILWHASATGAEPWQKLSDPEGNFKVSVPASPTKHVQTVETDVGKIQATYHLVELDGGNLVYAVAFSDYPQDFIDRSDPESILDGVREGNIKPHQGMVTKETKIQMDGYPGREYEFVGKLGGNGDPVVGHVRLFLAGPRLYQLIILAASSAPPGKEDIGRFFYSFERLAN